MNQTISTAIRGLDRDLWHRFRVQANDENRSIASILNELIAAYLQLEVGEQAAQVARNAGLGK